MVRSLRRSESTQEAAGTIGGVSAAPEPATGTADLAKRYVEDGYVVLPGLVSEAERATIAAEIDRFVAGGYPIANPVEYLGPDNPRSGILCVHFPHWVSQPIRRIVHHPGIVDVLTTITGAHLPFWDGRVKCMQSMLFLKPPGFPGQAWHQDERFIATRDRSLVGAWIALDDATEANGCLRVVPGSHRMGQLWPTAPHGKPEEYDPTDQAYGFADDLEAPNGEVLVEVAAGDVVFFNGYLLHRSRANRSSGTRRALVSHYMNAWSNLPWRTDGERLVDAATHDHPVIEFVAGDDPSPWRERVDPPGEVFLRPWHDRMDWGRWDRQTSIESTEQDAETPT